MRKKILYMPLLNEETKVSRPVIASEIGNNIYKILGTEQDLSSEELDEEWLFPVGSHVTCKIEQNRDGEILVIDKLHGN
ncbi:MAG: hypothetical protein LBR10_13195 [Prevotellaceae bacterium]|jgi:hypothetical protein|nr:hypothetical protein [Prevotellaceae bacterium]